MTDLRQTYNMIAQDWHQDHKKDTWWISATDRFLSHLQPGSLILDVGCGGGTKTHYFAKHSMKVIGIDLSEEMIKICQQENPDGKFLVMDMRNISELLETFDGIYAKASLLHIPKREASQVIKGLSNKLKKNGYLYLSVKEKQVEGVDEEEREESDYGYPYSRFFSYFTEEELRRYCVDAGVEIVEVFHTPISKTVWLQVIGRKQ